MLALIGTRRSSRRFFSLLIFCITALCVSHHSLSFRKLFSRLLARSLNVRNVSLFGFLRGIDKNSRSSGSYQNGACLCGVVKPVVWVRLIGETALLPVPVLCLFAGMDAFCVTCRLGAHVSFDGPD